MKNLIKEFKENCKNKNYQKRRNLKTNNFKRKSSALHLRI